MSTGSTVSTPTLPHQGGRETTTATVIRGHAPKPEPKAGRPVERRFANAGPDCYWELPTPRRADSR